MAPRSLIRALVVTGFIFAFVLWFSLLALREVRSEQQFDFVHWELTTVANKWLYVVGKPLRDDPSSEEALAAYFSIEDRESGQGRYLENVVESVIESRIHAVIREQRLSMPLLFSRSYTVWPPVDLELSGTPFVLVLSPRAEVRLLESRPLRLGLDYERLFELEDEAEARDSSLSALVVPTSGIATYPSIINNLGSYRSTVATGAHEWVHHYLAFYPLGRSFFSSGDARTINETVADIVGDELSDMVIARFGDLVTHVEPGTVLSIDRASRLRELRVDVDKLLKLGMIDDAERQMQDARDFLEDRGIFIRRINQAYFAWFGTYAARDDAIDPLGAQLRKIRELARSLERFLELIREVTTRGEVELLLSDLESRLD
jgi:hypothetical protein